VLPVVATAIVPFGVHALLGLLDKPIFMTLLAHASVLGVGVGFGAGVSLLLQEPTITTPIAIKKTTTKAWNFLMFILI
jgi:hypothetical protein